MVVVREPHEPVASLTCFQGLLIQLRASSAYGCGAWPIICSQRQKKIWVRHCVLLHIVFLKQGVVVPHVSPAWMRMAINLTGLQPFFFRGTKVASSQSFPFQGSTTSSPSVPGSGRTGLQWGPHRYEVLIIKAKGLCGGQWWQTIHAPAGLGLAEKKMPFLWQD